MKKLLLVLAVVAMASFLFVGCLPGGTTPDPDPDPDPTPDPVQAVTITVAGEYTDISKGLTYVAAASKLVTVTFVLPIAEEYGVQINGVPAAVKAGSGRKIWTLLVDFSADPYTALCVEQCITVTVGHPCCPDLADTYWKLVIPDGVAPCASFIVTFKDCGVCVVPPGASMSWTTSCDDICDVPKDCCGDDCSGVGDWSFVLDYDECEAACDTEIGTDCAIIGAFECGCLTYVYTDDTVLPNVVYTGIHEVLVTIKDNVGNVFTDTWTITFDTDNVTSIAAPKATTVSSPAYNATKKEWTVEVDYDCTWTDCATCFPSEV